MIYSYGCRIDNNSNVITVIDEENITAETKGYVNGEYVEFSGGGGSSDFSTAEVTIVNNAPDSVSFDLSLAIIMSAEGMSATLGGMSSYQIGSGVVAYAVLYKGIAGMELKSLDEYDFNIEASGDAQVTGRNCMITGDCTITIS